MIKTKALNKMHIESLLKNILLAVFAISFVLSIFNCTNQRPRRDCECSLKKIASEEVDSSIIKNKSRLSINNNLNIEALVSKIVDLEITNQVYYEPINDEKIRIIVSKIKNEFPDKNDDVFKYTIQQSFYCAIYQNLCKDMSLPDSSVASISNSILNKFYLKWDDDKSTSIKKSNADYKNKNPTKTFAIKGFNLDEKSKNILCFNTGYSFSSKKYNYLIELVDNGEIVPVNQSNTLFKYTGGYVNLKINENECFLDKKISIDATLPAGNQQVIISSYIDSVKSQIFKNHLNDFSKKILSCTNQ